MSSQKSVPMYAVQTRASHETFVREEFSDTDATERNPGRIEQGRSHKFKHGHRPPALASSRRTTLQQTVSRETINTPGALSHQKAPAERYAIVISGWCEPSRRAFDLRTCRCKVGKPDFAMTTFSLVLEATLNIFDIGNVTIVAAQFRIHATMHIETSTILHRTVADTSKPDLFT